MRKDILMNMLYYFIGLESEYRNKVITKLEMLESVDKYPKCLINL